LTALFFLDKASRDWALLSRLLELKSGKNSEVRVERRETIEPPNKPPVLSDFVLKLREGENRETYLMCLKCH
jgi:hypothetical protein